MTFCKLTRLQCLRLRTERRNHFKLHRIKSPMTHTPCENLSYTKDNHLNNPHNYIYLIARVNTFCASCYITSNHFVPMATMQINLILASLFSGLCESERV